MGWCTILRLMCARFRVFILIALGCVAMVCSALFDSIFLCLVWACWCGRCMISMVAFLCLGCFGPCWWVSATCG